MNLRKTKNLSVAIQPMYAYCIQVHIYIYSIILYIITCIFCGVAIIRSMHAIVCNQQADDQTIAYMKVIVVADKNKHIYIRNNILALTLDFVTLFSSISVLSIVG